MARGWGREGEGGLVEGLGSVEGEARPRDGVGRWDRRRGGGGGGKRRRERVGSGYGVNGVGGRGEEGKGA